MFSVNSAKFNSGCGRASYTSGGVHLVSQGQVLYLFAYSLLSFPWEVKLRIYREDVASTNTKLTEETYLDPF